MTMSRGRRNDESLAASSSSLVTNRPVNYADEDDDDDLDVAMNLKASVLLMMMQMTTELTHPCSTTFHTPKKGWVGTLTFFRSAEGSGRVKKSSLTFFVPPLLQRFS